MKNNAYHTYDIVLAAFLIAGDVSRITDIQALDTGRKLFQFDPRPTKEQLVSFYSGEATVSARRFAEVYSTLKGTNYTMQEFA